jgi:hypothetical protein
MEAAHFQATGSLLKLSEQNFVSCDTKSNGCNGGLEVNAFNYAKTHPQMLLADYPYTAKTGTCSYQAAKGKVTAKSITAVPKKSNAQLKASIEKGPTCVAVDAGKPFMSYKSGILNASNCGT